MQPMETSFVAFTFTEEEMKVARQISPEHKMYLQTLMCSAAESKLALKLDPYKPLEFVQEEAYTRGQMDILAMLLNDEEISRPKNAVQIEATKQET